MNGTLIVPSNLGRERKTRLAPVLPADAREELADALFGHVVAQAKACAAIDRILILSPQMPSDNTLDWIADTGAGLNAELERAAATLGDSPLAIVHADLPLLSAADLDALLAAATENGTALSADRHGTGTNALALTDASRLIARFGEHSFGAHRKAYPHAQLCEHTGLAFDLDGPDDLEALRGFTLPAAIAGTINRAMP